MRTVLGLTPLYIVLGGLQYLEATLSLRVEVLPSVWIYPASTVMFTATLAAVLLIYVKEDAIEARKLVYGLVLANVTAAIMSLLIGLHLLIWKAPTRRSLRVQDFMRGAWITTVGTSLLFIDVLGIILVYEFIARYVRGLFGPFFLALLAVASFDSMIFTQMVHGGRAGPPAAADHQPGGQGDDGAVLFGARVDRICATWSRAPRSSAPATSPTSSSG